MSKFRFLLLTAASTVLALSSLAVVPALAQTQQVADPGGSPLHVRNEVRGCDG